MMKFYFILAFLFGFGVSEAVIIQGTAKDYVAQDIKFYTKTNPITQQKSYIARAKVGESGQFYANIAVPGTMPLHIETGVYDLIIYVYPNGKYTIQLPPYKPKTPAQIISAFFRPKEGYVTILKGDENELNEQVIAFTEALQNVSGAYLTGQRLDETSFHKIKQIVDENYPPKLPYLKDFKKYMYGLLDLYTDRSISYYISTYLSEKPAYYNDAYQKFFQKLLKNPLLKNNSMSRLNQIDRALVRIDEKAFRVMVLGDLTLERTSSDLIMGRALYTLSFRPEYPKHLTMKCLSKTLSQTQGIESRIVLTETYDRLRWKTPEAVSPNYTFQLDNGKTFSVKQNKNYYTYLGFYTLMSPVCRYEISQIKKHYKMFQAHKIKVVSVFLYDDPLSVDTLIRDSVIPWTVIKAQDKTEEIKEMYEIMSYPSYILIDQSGRVKWNPAPSMLQDMTMKANTLRVR